MPRAGPEKDKFRGPRYAIKRSSGFAEDRVDHSILYSIDSSGKPTGAGRQAGPTHWMEPSGTMIAHCGQGVYVRTRSRSVIDVLMGFDDVKNWDNEELRYGRRRDIRGKLYGNPPRVIPQQCHQELTRRIVFEAEDKLRDEVMNSVEKLILIAKGELPAKSDQVRAISMHLERVIGKPVEQIDINAHMDAPWMEALAGGIIGSSAEIEASAQVIDIQSEEDEDDLMWDDV